MGKASVDALGGHKAEVGIITLTSAKPSFSAVEAPFGLQYHLSRAGTFGDRDYSHNLFFKSAAGAQIGMIRYGYKTSSEISVWSCDFADPSKFTLEVVGSTLHLYLWMEKEADGTVVVYDSAGKEPLLSGVAEIGYDMSSWRTDISNVFVVFLT